ncbi:hypothetical protein MSAN_00542800 [Mycena sanguinolenta]|uniref:CxC1-like cysteine cluster associated with KDZ transposases domain-containing protein n=1 Tax=Mycena sanguinolenta TaxID=230812 RepID=A0A8H7DHG3_9AGAR|nr:hypothetical protein MSAN_00542800 [Mycena sanguinolenta]
MPASRRAKDRASATSFSSRIRISATERTASGRVIERKKTLNATQIRAAKEEAERREIERRLNLTRKQQRVEDQWRDIPDAFDDDGGTYANDVLHGRATADISNAGERLSDEQRQRTNEEILKELQEHHHKLYGRGSDRRSRRDRTQRQVNAFAKQLERMTDAYIDWAAYIADEGLACDYRLLEDAIVQDTRRVLVVDMFSARYQDLHLIRGDSYVASACVRHGWMPVSPYVPNAVITIRALEAYRVAHLRCPRLGIQAFVRALSDIHGVAPRPWLSSQFSVAFDVYLEIRARAEKRVQVALGRDTPNWRLKNACPACLYKLEGEPRLKLPFLCTMDGNNSLSRFEVRERETYADGTTAPGFSRERFDDRVAAGDYYMSREEVDKWAKEGLEELMKNFEGTGDAGDEEGGSGCEERWQNMKDSVTTRAWGMYDETGIFPALCRHGFVLVVADMVKSGELAKYGFAVVEHLIKVLGEIASGYDVGCKFGKQVKAHPVLSKLAADNNYVSLVGAFHGLGHGRMCQTKNLTTYVEGVGTETLEGCETYFSKSNALASTTRHATRFHRQQAIVNYMKHTDVFETYHGLSTLLCSKYRRALEVLATQPTLHDAMRRLGVKSRAEFEGWLEKEKAHLRSLSKEPLQETLEMEYYQKLVNLADIDDRVAGILGVERPFMPAETDAGYADAAQATRRLETQRRHTLEQQAKALAAVQDLEVRLGVETRWVAGDANWVAAAHLVRQRRYQRALDDLERLIISRMFELSKCNMAGTGYKLRKHIAKALQVRSKALKAAITRYNDAASALTPPREHLDWEEVVENAFLADFDLLRDARQDIRQEPWALPAGRAAMEQHFKILRAKEEIERLNIEIRRFVTYIGDEEAFLAREESALREEGEAGLAHQVRLLRMERARFTAVHMTRLTKLSKAAGFTGSLSPGRSLSRERHTVVVRTKDADMRVPSPSPTDEEMEQPVAASDDDEDGDVEEDAEDDEGGITDALMNILTMTDDESGVQEE